MQASTSATLRTEHGDSAVQQQDAADEPWPDWGLAAHLAVRRLLAMTGTQPSNSPGARPTFRLGGIQLVLTVLVLAGTVLACVVIWWPYLAMEYVEYVVLPRYESRFGFRGGRITVEDSDGRRYSVYGIVDVRANGSFARSGFHSGDIPLGHHGGASELEWALMRAARGERPRVSVVQAREWGVRDRIIRELTFGQQ